jgi:N-formylmaleamate deformylase
MGAWFAAAATNPAARLVEVPAAGHMVFWDEPEAVRHQLREILGNW